MDLHVVPILIPPPLSLSTQSLWVFPVHQPRALVSYIQPGLVICFTLESILVSMLFSLNIPPSPSPTESKSLKSSAFSKSSLNICKFIVQVLLKPGLVNFEQYFASVWDECNCAVVWTFFGITFLWDGMKLAFSSPVATTEFSKFTHQFVKYICSFKAQFVSRFVYILCFNCIN